MKSAEDRIPDYNIGKPSDFSSSPIKKVEIRQGKDAYILSVWWARRYYKYPYMAPLALEQAFSAALHYFEPARKEEVVIARDPTIEKE